MGREEPSGAVCVPRRCREGPGARTAPRVPALLLGDVLLYVQICRRGEPKALLAFERGWVFGTLQGTTGFGDVLFWLFLHEGES